MDLGDGACEVWVLPCGWDCLDVVCVELSVDGPHLVDREGGVKIGSVVENASVSFVAVGASIVSATEDVPFCEGGVGLCDWRKVGGNGGVDDSLICAVRKVLLCERGLVSERESECVCHDDRACSVVDGIADDKRFVQALVGG